MSECQFSDEEWDQINGFGAAPDAIEDLQIIWLVREEKALRQLYASLRKNRLPVPEELDRRRELWKQRYLKGWSMADG